MDDQDVRFMRRCIELAQQGSGMVQGNPMVGAVLVCDGQIIAEGWHQEFGGTHAEVECLNHDFLDEKDFHDGVLYLNLEPCCVEGKTPACTDLILKQKIRKVVVGMVDPDERMSGRGVSLLRSYGIDVQVLCEQQGISDFQFQISKDDLIAQLHFDLLWLNRFFVKHRKTDLPWVTVKMAMSADGFVSKREIPRNSSRNTAKIFWITGEDSRDHVHEVRGEYGAIVVGVGTVLSDDPGLTTYGNGEWQPWRVVLDGDFVIPEDCRLVSDEYSARTIVFVRSVSLVGQDEKVLRLRTGGVKIIVYDQSACCDDTIEPEWVLKKLADEFEVNSVYVEGGPNVWKSFLDSDLPDEIQIYQSPSEMGEGIDSGLDMQILADKFRLQEKQLFGNDVWRRWLRKH